MSRYEFFEEADMSSDPLTQLLMREEAQNEVDELEAMYRSQLHRTKTSEKDNDEVFLH